MNINQRFEQLYHETENYQVENIDLNSLSSKINTIRYSNDQTQIKYYQYILFLIYLYEFKMNGKITPFPYGGKSVTNNQMGYRTLFDNLPPQLILIIKRFLQNPIPK